ncbi:MAG TPA: FixH family protein [Candidatus Acidoferrales bacterium]|nr:FixH family protein [Candidatus Acidoferrales bacterium]
MRLEQEFEKGRSSGGVIPGFRLESRTCSGVQPTQRVRTLIGTGIRGALRNRALPAFVCAAILFVSGCRKAVEPQAAIAIECGISPQPVRVGPVVFSVKLRDAAGAPAVGARVKLEADMSHPGMAPVFGEAREAAPGRYQGSLEFGMPGDWVALIHVTLPDGLKLEREVSVPGVTAN